MVLAFVIVFVGGPLIFRTVSRAGLRRRMLAVIAIGFMVLALVVRYSLAEAWGVDARMVLLVLCLIWMAWIVLLVWGVQVVRQFQPDGRIRRWATIIGMAGTTVPWFGLVTARLLDS